MTTYTIEIDERQLNHLLAEMNIARLDSQREGLNGSERANRRLATEIIQQSMQQGFRDEESGGVNYGGEIVTLTGK